LVFSKLLEGIEGELEEFAAVWVGRGHAAAIVGFPGSPEFTAGRDP